jgi:iron complex outermembrane receptor protein
MISIARMNFKAGSLCAAVAMSSGPALADETATKIKTVEIKTKSAAQEIHGQSKTINLGPLGAASVLNTAASVNIVPKAIIQTQQLKSVADILRYIPSVQADSARPMSRGFQGSVAGNTRLDGLNIVSTTDYPAEEFDRVDVLDGLSGAIYGPTNPAGTFDFIAKRPTSTRLRSIRIGYTAGGAWLRTIDFSDRTGPVGYRVNLLDEDGHAYTPGSRLRRKLASLALDFHLDSNTVLQTDYSHYHYELTGAAPNFALASGVSFPNMLDPADSGLAQSYAGNVDTTDTVSARLLHAFSPGWSMTAGILYQQADRISRTPTVTFTNNKGTYTSTSSTATASRFTITSNLLYLNGVVQTGPVQNTVAIGTNGFQMNNFNPLSGSTVVLGKATLADQQAFAQPAYPDFTDRYKSAQAWQQALVLSDSAALTQRLTFAVTGSESWLTSNNYSVRGVQTSASSNNGFSPSLSLLYKPRPDLTVYATYANSLQQGDTAPSGTANANSILAPYRSTQYETGIKLGLPRILLTLAAYQISRPFAFTDATTKNYGVGGQQRNRGIEFMANGEVLPGLAIFGGATYLDPELLDTASASTDDKRIVGLANFVMSVLLSYQFPHVAGLSVDSVVRQVSNRPTDDANLTYAPGYTTLDLGAVYVLPAHANRITLRLDATNVTNARYLTDIVPGGLNGFTGAGNASAQLGAPRSIDASVQVDF